MSSWDDLHHARGLAKVQLATGHDTAGLVPQRFVPDQRRAHANLTTDQVSWFAAPKFMEQELVARFGLNSVTYDMARGHSMSVEGQLALAGMSVFQPELVATWLQEALDNHRVTVRNPNDVPGELRGWWDCVAQFRLSLPSQLHGAAAVANARVLSLRNRGVRELEVRRRLAVLDSFGVHPDVVELAALIATVDACTNDGDLRQLQREAEVRAYQDRINPYYEPPQTENIAPLVPWLFMWQSHAAEMYLMTAADMCPPIRAALAECASAPYPPLAAQAQGLADAAAGKAEPIISGAARWTIERKYLMRPQSLEAPSSTWLDSPALENTIRFQCETASASWLADGLTQEEQQSGALLERLALGLADVRGIVGARGPGHVVRLDAKMTRKKDENDNGTDLGLLVTVKVPGVQIVKAHLVQIKRAELGISLRWKIDIEQLLTLLEHDQSATYWLLSSDAAARLLCVPASYLLAVITAAVPEKVRLKKGTRNVHLSSVTSAGVPLGDVICDLALGLWVGTTAEKGLKVVAGTSSTYTVANLIEIEIRSGD